MVKNKKPYHEKMLFMVLLFMMSGMAFFSSDIYIAAFPAMGHDLAASPDLIKGTVSMFFIGLGGSQLFYGPISDYVGRKKIAVFGLVVFIVGCALCALSKDYSIFLFGRLIQGIGSGATTCLSRAIMRDSYTGARLVKIISYVGMGVALIPAIAPLIGGYIQYGLGWKFEFAFLILYALILLILLSVIVPETNAYVRQHKKSVLHIVRDYKNTLMDFVFLMHVLTASFFVSMIYVFYTVTSYYFQSDLHWTELEYSRISIAIAIAMFLGRKLNTFLSSKFSRGQVILIGTGLGLISGLCMLVLSSILINPFITIILPISLYGVAAGVVFPNTFVGATEQYKKTIGLVSSLYGFTQMTTAFLLISLSSLLGVASIVGVGVMIICLAGFSLCGMLYLKEGDKNDA